MKSKDRKQAGRGAALIAVLWIVAVMGTITMILSRQTRLSLKINKNMHESEQAMMLAEAGVYRAIAELMQDGQQTTNDNLSENWNNNQSLFFDAPLGKGVYRLVHPDVEETSTVGYGVMDECGKLNINTADANMLLQLPNATEDVVDAIIDWRDEDSNPQPYGAEDEYYQSLPEPYFPKNNLIDSLEELLLVKGVALDLLYGEDFNTNGVLDVQENDGQANYPLDNGDGVLERGWYPYLTCYSYEKNVDEFGEPRLNINSADRETMQQKFGSILTDVEIDAIINGRQQNNFQSVGDLLTMTSANQGVITGGGGGRNQGPGNNNASSNNNTQGSLTRDHFKEIVDQITVTDEEDLPGRVNLNTASRTVLICLFQGDEELVDQVIKYRSSVNGRFNNVGDLLDVPGITNTQFSQAANLVCTKSAVFSMRSTGYQPQSKAYKEIYAIVDRGGDMPQIRYWKILR